MAMARLYVQGLVLLAMAVTSVCLPASPPPPGRRTCICRQRGYCFMQSRLCPRNCPEACTMDCQLCRPICSCDKPGAVCQDPRFIGGDGIMFYFHGKKDADFCLLSDHGLHINAHFIGKSQQAEAGPHKKKPHRDFTWVQAIAILHGSHRIILAATRNVGIWSDSVDQLAITFDGLSLDLPTGYGHQAHLPGGLSITRTEDVNGVLMESKGHFRIEAKVVPVTAHESRIHNYNIIPEEDCFAHLEIKFKFFNLSSEVNGVLGQTYAPAYKSRVDLGAAMPIMGGDENYAVSSLTTPDCKVARYGYVYGYTTPTLNDFGTVSCTSNGRAGAGMVCRR